MPILSFPADTELFEELDRLVYLARKAQPGRVPPSRGTAHLPEIRLHPGRRAKVVDALEDALIAAD